MPGNDVLIGDNELMFGVDVPDWVRLPVQLGGAEVKVLSAFAAPCPKCVDQGTAPVSGGGVHVRHLRLEGGIHVAECVIHKFMWYTLKPTPTNEPTRNDPSDKENQV